jgi:hypothetical protein
MKILKLTTKFLTLFFAILTFAIVGAKADKLDDIIASGEIKCGGHVGRTTSWNAK